MYVLMNFSVMRAKPLYPCNVLIAFITGFVASVNFSVISRFKLWPPLQVFSYFTQLDKTSKIPIVVGGTVGAVIALLVVVVICVTLIIVVLLKRKQVRTSKYACENSRAIDNELYEEGNE